MLLRIVARPVVSTLLVVGALARARIGAPPDPDGVRRLQERRLRRLVRHAYERVPYYRRLFDAHGLHPRHVRALEDLRRIPVTTRATLQTLAVGDLVARGVDPQRLQTFSTSGSTGRPLTVRRSWVEDRVLATVRQREMRALGLRSADRVVVVKTTAAPRAEARGAVASLLRRMAPDTWQVVDCTLEPAALARRLRELRPDVLTGYPSSLTRLATEAERTSLRALGIRAVWTGGEVLTGEQRAAISDAFGVPVYDTYSSYEFDLLARECPRAGGYHVCDDSVVLEISSDGRPVEAGGRGEVVATALCSFAMPFLRYALADVAERGPAPCACGSAASTLREISGRVLDFFKLPDGRVLHPYGVFLPIRARSPWILQFQVRQLAVDRIVMQVVPKTAPDAPALALVCEMARESLGHGVRFELEVVGEIAPDPSGKLRTYGSVVGLPDTTAA